MKDYNDLKQTYEGKQDELNNALLNNKQVQVENDNLK